MPNKTDPSVPVELVSTLALILILYYSKNDPLREPKLIEFYKGLRGVGACQMSLQIFLFMRLYFVCVCVCFKGRLKLFRKLIRFGGR